MADYASVDHLGKLDTVGANVNIVGSPADSPLTSSFYVVVLVSVPEGGHDQRCDFELCLTDESGAVVVAPGEAEQPVVQLRQAVTFSSPTIPENFSFAAEDRLSELLGARLQLVAGFPIGLPLAGGQGYKWRITIDGVARDEWGYKFIVADQASPAIADSGKAGSGEPTTGPTA